MEPVLSVVTRNGETVHLSASDVVVLRLIVEKKVLGGTLTSTSLTVSERRKMISLSRRGIVNIGTADEGDARSKAYSINDWRISDAVMKG
jgi:hypothetical protein